MGDQEGEMVLRFTLFISVKHFKTATGNVTSKVRVTSFRIMHCKHVVPNLAPDPE